MVALGFNRAATEPEIKFPILTDIWETFKPRKLEDFPAYGLPPPIAPNHWKNVQHDYVFNGEHKQAELFVSAAQKPERIILYALGWNSTAAEKQDVIAAMNAHNATVIVLPLVSAGMRTDTMPENIERIGSLAFDPNSILQELNPDNLPIHIVTHSAGSQAYLHAVTDRIADIKKGHNIVSVQHTGSFIDAANASWPYHPFKSFAYAIHASHNKDKYVGTTLADRFYYLVNGLSDRLRTEDPLSRPTHGQNLMLIDGGRVLPYISEQLRDSGYLHFIPRETYLYSPNDDFSGKEAIIHLAKVRDVPNERIISVAGGHSILEQPVNIDLIFENMKRDEAEHFAYINRSREENISLNDWDLEEMYNELEVPDITESKFPQYARGAFPIHTPAL